MPCIFCHAQFIPTQLNDVKQAWKHKIEYSNSCHISGIPNQLHHVSQSKGYISQAYHVTESDLTNAFLEKFFKDELGEVINRTNKDLKKFFDYIISRQQLNYPLSN